MIHSPCRSSAVITAPTKSAGLRAGPPDAGLRVQPGSDTATNQACAPTPAKRRSEREHPQHGLIALLLELRDVEVLAQRDPAQPGEDRHILLTVDLERHGRRVEAGADIDLPQLPQRRVI